MRSCWPGRSPQMTVVRAQSSPASVPTSTRPGTSTSWSIAAAIVSHVPGGVGVFEAVILFTLPGVPPDALLGSLLAYRAVYYLVPLIFGTLLFAAKELAGQRERLAWAQELASLYIAPVVPQIAGSLTFLAGVYGMNMDIPENHWKYSYPAFWGICIATAAGMIFWFRRRGWL